MHENRETSEMPEEKLIVRPAGEGDSRTSRTHVSEESDSGVLPMNRSNKDGKPSAESEEGRTLIKENTQQPSPTSAAAGMPELFCVGFERDLGDGGEEAVCIRRCNSASEGTSMLS